MTINNDAHKYLSTLKITILTQNLNTRFSITILCQEKSKLKTLFAATPTTTVPGKKKADELHPCSESLIPPYSRQKLIQKTTFVQDHLYLIQEKLMFLSHGIHP